ncbi:potassium/proton antiporter [Salinicoccus hispanicus]|uniref:Potassium/proton antiporter n=1 Tax=Salinicoccus hispanicus TaxID=157225 RepID=A0A6N8U3Y2_9STAP|nr:potassium/proton antiporter [Salinicoccus hispanicus]MXQ51165.1 potassium/proton antiporter [Salinicoccus hispanicus]
MDVYITQPILLVAIVLVLGVVITRFSSKLGFPSLVLFIIIGILLNQVIYYDDVETTQLIGMIALIIILFEGGLQTNITAIKKVAVPAVLLATIGVLLTSLILGVFAYFILDLNLMTSMLLGAIVGSTDAAAVFAVFGSKNIKEKLSSTIEAESGTNDPMAVFLTVTIISIIEMPGETNVFLLILSFFWQMGIAVLVGIIIGRLAVYVINRIDLEASGLYPVLSLGFAMLSFGVAEVIGASGLLAVYIMALLMGNRPLTYKHSILRFNEGLAWMMQIIMFIMLGLLAFPDELFNYTIQGILMALILIFIARPIGVFLTLIASKYDFKEKVFISWAGLRGSVPIVLATYPLVSGIENGYLIFNVVFFIVIFSALLQGSTITPVARWLGFDEGETDTPAYSVELLALGQTQNDIYGIELPVQSAHENAKIKDLDLPPDILVIAIIRDEELITPNGETVMHSEDFIYVMMPRKLRERTEAYFSKVKEKENKGGKSKRTEPHADEEKT